MTAPISTDLSANVQQLAKALAWPKNLGIEFRPLTLGAGSAANALLITVDGLCTANGLSAHVLRPLAEFRGALSPAALMRVISVGRQQCVGDLNRVVEAVLDGWAALLVAEWDQALLLDVIQPMQKPAGELGREGDAEVFSRDWRINIALIRKRLRDPKLRAYRVDLARPRAGGVALVYLEGKASRALVRAVRRWAYRHAGEEAASRGLMQWSVTPLGLLPRFTNLRWANLTAMLIDVGHVVLLIDGRPYAYAAPVTHASWLISPSDYGLVFPVKRWLARIRICTAFLVATLPALVVALLNYHQEMVPVGFLLAVASARENAPFGIFFEALGAELLVEAAREAAFRLPTMVPIGSSLVSTVLVLLVAVETGFIGPAPALMAAAGALLSLALPSYDGAYLMRLWRFYLMLGAVIMGFFGIAFVFFLLLTYLHQATSWGVPFLGPGGWELTAPETPSTRRPVQKGANPHAKGHGLVR